MAAFALGGTLAEQGRNLVYLMSVLMPLLAVPVCLFALTEPHRHSAATGENTAFWSTLREGVRVSLASKVTLLILATFVLLNLVPEALEEYEAPLLDQLPDISPTLIGMLLAGFTLANILGNLLAERMSAGGLHSVVLAYGLIGLLLLPLMAVPASVAIAIIALMCFLHGIGTVLLQGVLQRSIHDDARSTVTSLANFAQSALALPFYGAFGLYATGYGFAAAFTMTGVFTVVIASSLSLLTGRVTNQHQTVQSEGPDS